MIQSRFQQAHVTLTAKTSSDEEMNVLNVNGNFCNFLVRRKDGNIRLFFENIQKFGKIFLECPIKKVRTKLSEKY